MRIFESSFDLTMLNFRFSDKLRPCFNPGCYLGQFAVFCDFNEICASGGTIGEALVYGKRWRSPKKINDL